MIDKTNLRIETVNEYCIVNGKNEIVKDGFYSEEEATEWLEEVYGVKHEPKAKLNLSEQVKELREMSKKYPANIEIELFEKTLLNAADTIESISAKLQAANKKVERLREITRCDGEWIYCADRGNLPTESGEYRTISNCQEIFANLNFDVLDGTWYDDGGQYHDVIAWWKVYPYEI